MEIQNVFEKDHSYKISRSPHENLLEVILEDHYQPKKKIFQEKELFQGGEGV